MGTFEIPENPKNYEDNVRTTTDPEDVLEHVRFHSRYGKCSKILNTFIFLFSNKLSWVKVFRINPEFRILGLTFHRKSASKY